MLRGIAKGHRLSGRDEEHPGESSQSSPPRMSIPNGAAFCAEGGACLSAMLATASPAWLPRAEDAPGIVRAEKDAVDPQVASSVQYWMNEVLVWVGFGTLVGLLAKAIMPGRDPGGPLVTLAMGIGGTVIGCGVVGYFFEGKHVTPISPLGFAIGTAGAFIILFFYRMLAGYWFVEGDQRPAVRLRPHYRRRRRYVSAPLDEEIL